MKFAKILAITCPIATIPTVALPITSCGEIQKDHSDEVIVFNNNEQSITIQLTSTSDPEIKVPFKVKQLNSTKQKFTIKWTIQKGDQNQLTVDLVEAGQNSYILIKPNTSITGEGVGWIEVFGSFINKYSQQTEASAICWYTIKI